MSCAKDRAQGTGEKSGSNVGHEASKVTQVKERLGFLFSADKTATSLELARMEEGGM
jgi:hypothetical protein